MHRNGPTVLKITIMPNQKLYDDFEMRLTDELVKLCTGNGMLEGEMLSSDDIDEVLNNMLSGYINDALREFDQYPEASVAFAGYVGMAVAHWWDGAWDILKSEPYSSLYGKRGFDDMDENITEKILGLDLRSSEALKLAALMNSCAHKALGMIRHENIEAGTEDAFYILVRTIYSMMRVGASVQLNALGYHAHKLG